ncbi:MAG TPA: hypothetical protein VFP93_01805 [Gammaproteobacteria bacterium]|nr:hypothetical protein [Gammaproteobacteria bacterium]
MAISMTWSVCSYPHAEYDEETYYHIKLQAKWRKIRMQELQRQLQAHTGCNFILTTNACTDYAQGTIYIPENILLLPIEVFTAFISYEWALRMLEKQQSSISPRDAVHKSLQLVGLFLAKNNYDIDHVIKFCLKNNQIPKELNPFSKHLISLMVAFKKALLLRKKAFNPRPNPTRCTTRLKSRGKFLFSRKVLFIAPSYARI